MPEFLENTLDKFTFRVVNDAKVEKVVSGAKFRNITSWLRRD
jgi:hypothetical protein